MRRWLCAIILSVSCLVPLGRHALADVNDFVITNFEADYYLSRTDPQGQMSVTERIDVHFNDYNHGILRAIPETYHGHPLHLKISEVSSPTGTPSQYTTYGSNDNTVLKIGDPGRTVTGEHSYLIKYSLDNVISFTDSQDELFWDINGDQWSQSFNSVTARFHIPAGLATNFKSQQKCYAGGGFGSLREDCRILVSDEAGGKLVTFTASDLDPRETLTTVMAFDKATFQPFTWRDTVSEHNGDIIISATSLLALATVFRRWWRWGRDPKGKGLIVPEYGPPKGVSILDAGILQDYRLDNKDVTAIIIDLAIRGYVTINEEDKKVLMFKTGTSTSLTLNKTDSKLADYERSILEALFDKQLKTGSNVSLGKYISGMQGVISGIGKQSLKKLEDAGYFDKSPDRPSAWLLVWMLVVCIFMIPVGFWSSNYLGGVVSILCVIAIIFLMALMPRRTAVGVMYNEQLAGLRLYLSTAEADRIKMMQSPNAPYAQNAHEPKRTVKLFEKLLPFAIIFGVEGQWAKQFENIYKTPPDWYNGNWRTFNAVMLANHISTSNAAFNASFSPPSSSGSGSSGFSGGGSGGGGGGGGGGGW